MQKKKFESELLGVSIGLGTVHNELQAPTRKVVIVTDVRIPVILNAHSVRS